MRPFERRPAIAILALFALVLPAISAQADITIVLKKSFVSKYKNRALVDTPLTPFFASPKPKAPSQDGDVHIASTASKEVGLVLVAEICNSKSQLDAFHRVQDAIKNHETIPVTGVWRLWCEHGGDNTFSQGAEIDDPTDTNPDHVFEIHPLTTVDGQDVRASFIGITGYTYKDAEDAFQRYEALPSHITSTASTISVRTRMAGFNYVQFQIRLEEDPPAATNQFDSTFVYSSIYALDGSKVVGGAQKATPAHPRRGLRRMVFVRGTPPDELVHTLHKGSVLNVVGIPRIDLALVEWRASHTAIQGAADWSLPYEMVILDASVAEPE
jgi:hypothetical protein